MRRARPSITLRRHGVRPSARDHVVKVVERVEARLRGDVRRQDDVAEAEQLVVVAAGRFVERIEREAADLAGFQRRDQRRAVDHVGASRR